MNIKEIKEELGMDVGTLLHLSKDKYVEGCMIAWPIINGVLHLIKFDKFSVDKLCECHKDGGTDESVDMEEVQLYVDITHSSTDAGVPFIMRTVEYWYDDPDPDGSLQNAWRSEGREDDGDWGGLYGEEADLGRWNCD
jgi:hypothetical protein